MELVGGLGAGLDGSTSSDPQQPDRFHLTGPGLRGAGRFTGQDGSSGTDRVGRVGLAVTATMLPVRAGHLEHRDILNSEVPGQTRTPRPGAFDTDGDDLTQGAQPSQQLPIAGRRRRERFGAEHPPDLVERSSDVDVLVRVDAAACVTSGGSVIVVIAIPSSGCGWHAQPVTDRPMTRLLHELLSGHVRPTGCAGGAPLNGPTDRHEDIDESGDTRVRPDERSATTILTGVTGYRLPRFSDSSVFRVSWWVCRGSRPESYGPVLRSVLTLALLGCVPVVRLVVPSVGPAGALLS